MTKDLRKRVHRLHEHKQHEHKQHEHRAVIAHALRQQAGIPYEVEQHVCSDCRRVLDERTVRRAAA
jgi:hypothetical protein